MSLPLMGAGLTVDSSIDPSFTTLLAKLVAQYKFDSSNFLDNSSNAYTLTKGSTAVFGNTAGDFYYSPDGTGANTDSGGPSTFANIAAQDFTVAITFNFASSTDMLAFLNGTSLSVFNFYISADTGNNCFLFLRKAASPGVPITWSGGLGISAGAYISGTKVHFIYSYTAASPLRTCTTYKNGVLVGTSSHAAGQLWAPSGSTTGIIGVANTGQLGLVADKVYDVLVFNAALTQLEATYLAANHAPF